MNRAMEALERFLELGSIKKDITLLVISGAAVVGSLLQWRPFPFDLAWVAIILCGVPIILEAVIGLVTAFDIKADVLVSLALIASVCIGQDFAAGEVAFIMQLGGLLEELTVARARAGHREAGPPDAPDRPGPAKRRGGDRPRRAGPGGGPRPGPPRRERPGGRRHSLGTDLY